MRAIVLANFWQFFLCNKGPSQVIFVKRPNMTSSETIMGSFIYTREYSMVNDK